MSDSMEVPPPFTTPILFLIFNRPSTTKRVLDRIREIRPTRLFVAADGPRAHRPDDVQNCQEVLSLIDGIDWPCEVVRLIRSENLGCGRAVSSAITWFLEQVEEGIILEDDVLPSISFFSYCEELLNRYRGDSRVMSISGSALVPGLADPRTSYRFSRYVGIWGWATWRRAWKDYDYQMNSWRDSQVRRRVRGQFSQPQFRFLANVFDGMVTTGADTWDYQWWFHVLQSDGLSVAPARNLTVNLGFDGSGTHTHHVDDRLKDLASEDLALPLKHPTTVACDRTGDAKLARIFYWKKSSMTILLDRVIRRLSRWSR